MIIGMLFLCFLLLILSLNSFFERRVMRTEGNFIPSSSPEKGPSGAFSHFWTWPHDLSEEGSGYCYTNKKENLERTARAFIKSAALDYRKMIISLRI